MKATALLFVSLFWAKVTSSETDSAHKTLLRSVLQGKLEQTCDNYCTNGPSDVCVASDKADLSITYPFPSMWVNPEGKTSYAKCFDPFKGNGKSIPIACPKNKYPPVGCETCGYSQTFSANSPNGIGSNGETAPFSEQSTCCPGFDGRRYSYNYAWNKDKGKRGAWAESKGKCWARWGCGDGYTCQGRSWWGGGTCKIDSDARFLGESCSNSPQCNKVSGEKVRMACGRVSKKCMLAEDAEMEIVDNGLTRKRCSCSIFDHWEFRSTFTGLLSCTNWKDCGGAECTLTTMDGNKYCHHTDVVNAKCSNCRASSDSCKA